MIKFLHIIGVIMFFGNITISAVWRLFAEKSGEASVVKHALNMIQRTDLMFTLPGVLLIGITGHMLAPKFGGIAGHPWIYHSYALLTISALIWLAARIPIQIKQRRLLASESLAIQTPQFKKLTLWWSILGAITIILILTALTFMTIRPA